MTGEKEPFFIFDSNACKRCGGKCCRGHEGYIWVSMEELEEMAAMKEIELPMFANHYLRQVQGKFSLQERVINGEHLCCFFDPIAGQCTMYQSRPEQCRTFPFWNSLMNNPQKLVQSCPGVVLR